MIRHAHMIFVNALFLRAFIYAHTPAQLTTGRNAVMLVCFTTASVKILGRYVGSGGRNSEARMAKYCCTRPYSKKPKPLDMLTVRGFSMASRIARLVISWKTMRLVRSTGRPNTSVRCHAMASPSRSSSEASHTVFVFASFASSSTTFFLSPGIS